MPNLLVIHTSLNGTHSLSSSLANDAVDLWKSANPLGTVSELNFAESPVPHLDAETFAAFLTPDTERTPEQQELAALSDALIQQISEADEVVMAVPMYNFGVPSKLRAYFDHIARAGVTFRYTPEGPVGLLDLNKVTVIATRGGTYAGTPLDTQSQYLKNFFAFLGVTNVEFAYAEGTAMGDEALAAAISEARSTLVSLALH